MFFRIAEKERHEDETKLLQRERDEKKMSQRREEVGAYLAGVGVLLAGNAGSGGRRRSCFERSRGEIGAMENPQIYLYITSDSINFSRSLQSHRTMKVANY